MNQPPISTIEAQWAPTIRLLHKWMKRQSLNPFHARLLEQHAPRTNLGPPNCTRCAKDWPCVNYRLICDNLFPAHPDAIRTLLATMLETNTHPTPSRRASRPNATPYKFLFVGGRAHGFTGLHPILDDHIHVTMATGAPLLLPDMRSPTDADLHLLRKALGLWGPYSLAQIFGQDERGRHLYYCTRPLLTKSSDQTNTAPCDFVEQAQEHSSRPLAGKPQREAWQRLEQLMAQSRAHRKLPNTTDIS